MITQTLRPGKNLERARRRGVQLGEVFAWLLSRTDARRRLGAGLGTGRGMWDGTARVQGSRAWEVAAGAGAGA